MQNFNGEYDEEEEEIVVYANFEEGTVDRDIFNQSDVKFKIIGLESDVPIVQLGDTTFKGVWNDTIGTKVFFEEDLSPEQVDPVFTVLPSKMLKYKCMATKTLELSRIFLKPKNLEDNINNTSVVLETDDRSSGSDEQEEILELAQCTINPNLDTDSIMKDIVEESTMEATE